MDLSLASVTLWYLFLGSGYQPMLYGRKMRQKGGYSPKEVIQLLSKRYMTQKQRLQILKSMHLSLEIILINFRYAGIFDNLTNFVRLENIFFSLL